MSRSHKTVCPSVNRFIERSLLSLQRFLLEVLRLQRCNLTLRMSRRENRIVSKKGTDDSTLCVISSMEYGIQLGRIAIGRHRDYIMLDILTVFRNALELPSLNLYRMRNSFAAAPEARKDDHQPDKLFRSRLSTHLWPLQASPRCFSRQAVRKSRLVAKTKKR